jgi:hypothetical protein
MNWTFISAARTTAPKSLLGRRVHDEDGGEDEEEGGADNTVGDHEDESDQTEHGE